MDENTKKPKQVLTCKSYEIGQYSSMSNLKLYAQACSYLDGKATLRVVAAPQDKAHEKWQFVGPFSQVVSGFNSKDTIFESIEDAERFLEVLAANNNWPWYY